MCNPSADGATVAWTILPGKLARGCGSVCAATCDRVWSVVTAPVVGSNSVKLVVVTTKARLSMPKATPSGALPRANVWMALFAVKSISDKTLLGDAGAALLPKCAIASQWPSGDMESELGWGATLIDVWMVLSLSDITSMRLAVKLAI